jgi:cytochrome c
MPMPIGKSTLHYRNPAEGKKMMIRTFHLALALACCVASGPAVAAGDPAAGKVLFARCSICHSTDAGVNKIGPSLHGVVGRPSATVASFNYSPAMHNAHKVWDEAQLDAYIADPRAVVPNTKMIFLGIKSETDRQNLIAYLATLK